MSITIREIARALNISHSTVSRALRDHPSVSDYTRERVRRTAAAMGYRANQPARALASRRVRVVALIIPDVVDPFYARIVEGVDEIAHKCGYALLLYVTHSDSRREYAALDGAAMHQYDGTILFRRHTSLGRLRSALTAGTPLVLLTRHHPGLGADSIRVDDVDGGYKATLHLLELGHRRIACLTGPSGHQETDDRLAGFHRAHRDFGLVAEPSLIWEGDFQTDSGERAAERLLQLPHSHRPSAVFAFNDQMAIGFLRKAATIGLAVPHDISVIGYDDIEPARYASPMLSTIKQPTREMGRIAAELLIRRLEGEPFPPQEILLKTELVVRDSTAPPPDGAPSESITAAHGGDRP